MSGHSVKKSTIFVSVEDRTEVYRSIEEMPAHVRKKLLDSAGKWDSATILIADRRGREEIARAVRGRPGPVRFRFLDGLRRVRQDDRETSSRPRSYRRWLGLAVFLAASIFTFLAFTILD